MIAIESAQSTKETGQQPAAPDGPHTSPLTHTLAHVSAYPHFYLHLHTHLHIYPPTHTFTYTYTYTHTCTYICLYTLTLTHTHLHLQYRSYIHLYTHKHTYLYICLHTFTYTCTYLNSVRSPSCYRAMAISGRRGADASIHISTYGCLPITTRGLDVQVLISPYPMKSFTPKLLLMLGCGFELALGLASLLLPP